MLKITEISTDNNKMTGNEKLSINPVSANKNTLELSEAIAVTKIPKTRFFLESHSAQFH